SVASNPSSTCCRRSRPILLMLVSNAAEIALSLHPSPISDVSAFNRMRALVSNCAGLLPAWIKASSRARSSALSFTTYFLTAISFPATNHLHRLIPATEIQKNATVSMTLGTSRRRDRGKYAIFGGFRAHVEGLKWLFFLSAVLVCAAGLTTKMRERDKAQGVLRRGLRAFDKRHEPWVSTHCGQSSRASE